MGKLKYLIIHCSASQDGKDLCASDIRREHTLPPPQGRGWKQVGYSDLVLLSGEIVNLVPYDGDDIVQPREVTNGAVGLNGSSRHICYVGGLDKHLKPKDTRTEEQINALKNYVYDAIEQHPQIKILGHNQVAKKACPSFDVPEWLVSIGINKANIY